MTLWLAAKIMAALGAVFLLAGFAILALMFLLASFQDDNFWDAWSFNTSRRLAHSNRAMNKAGEWSRTTFAGRVSEWLLKLGTALLVAAAGVGALAYAKG